MATPEELIALADEIASGDKSIASDGKSLTAHDLTQLIEYIKFKQGQAAGVSPVPGLGLRFVQLVPPGAG